MADIQVGDLVNVPGGMYGTVRFIGTVAGKPGRFAGVELAAEHASRGKNNGDVDGRTYFKTSIPGSGIFVPINNNKYVTKRLVSTPPTPVRSPVKSPIKSSTMNFSKSVGPSPAVPKPRMRRPSLHRPESPRGAPPSKLNLAGLRTPSAPMRTLPTNGFSRSPMKTPSRLSDRPPSRVSVEDDTPTSVRTSDPLRLQAGGAAQAELQELRDKVQQLEARLKDRDKQLEDQAATLAEFQKSITELEGSDALSIRAQLREKNEKIAQLTAEFDSHRADFRSTLDTLEIAASETERVYERRLDELMQQNRELQDRGEDVETVARQLKQLEELVSELEEGLEDARRGEAEARAEVEFLRGEVERTKLELKQEREKAVAALRDVESSSDSQRHAKELDQKEDEIRGLKAIIHSLSRGEANPAVLRQDGASGADHESQNPEKVAQLEERVQQLEGITELKDNLIEELERQLEQMHLNDTAPGRNRSATVSKRTSAGNGTNPNVPHGPHHAHQRSDRTVVPNEWNDGKDDTAQRPALVRGRSDDMPRRLDTMHEVDNQSSDAGSSAAWCEICEMSGHDILTCTNMFGNANGKTQNAAAMPVTPEPDMPHVGGPVTQIGLSGGGLNIRKNLASSPSSQRTGRDAVLEGLKGIGGLTSSMSPVAGKESGVVDESKWCALCERDGHESIDCPFED
ncbi:hypothetical protein DTO027B5_1916 [Paecilomyces variotii]|nr:hypothetical protein DTO169C6_988 [Paecilomyces variotii]KAJ9327528.1 hypothetical protein DTO027B3_1750 [Paecilomyces variotii]KAJ9336235.1 hypothetical protein DTO027B5_1916 [Paecilomyces variotii]